jgi:iron complex outermembrane receptor protein
MPKPTAASRRNNPLESRRSGNWNSNRLTLAIACAMAGSTLSGASLAQTPPAPNGQLEEIVVTAQFRSQNLQQTPVAITAVNSETMEARSQTSVFEVSAQAPNVTLKPQGAAFGPALSASIRGVGQYDFNPAYEPGVGMYIDDVYYATLTGSIFDLLDLDRVEILRGPQGTLAGKNSIGGAVKLYSRKPTGDNTGSIQASYGSRNRIDLRASGDFALSESVSVRLSGVSKKQQGYVERIDYGCAFPTSGVQRQLSQGTNCRMAREGEVDYDAIRAMLRFDNGGPIALTLIGDYTHDDRTTAATVMTYANYTGTRDINPYATAIALDSRFVPPAGSYYNWRTARYRCA